MRKLLFFLFVVIGHLTLFGQELNQDELNKFASAEKLLQEYTAGFKHDSIPFEQRVQLIHDFIPRFVGILKEKNSFYYPFDSLQSVIKVYAPDNTFRIFTWQLKEPLGTHKYYGALQLNSEELKLFPLFDYSDTMTVHPQEILPTDNWYGAIYYNCIQQKIDGKSYYTLLGFDEADFVSNRKLIEVLSFDEESKPTFGAPILSITDSNNVTTIKNRFFLEYTDKASVKLNYDEEHQKIIFDHLVPPSEREADAWFSYIPDGTYEGFVWENSIWKWVEKIFHYSIGEPDSPPMPNPILDNRD